MSALGFWIRRQAGERSRVLLLALAGGIGATTTLTARAAERRPDIVIFLTHDHSQRDATPYAIALRPLVHLSPEMANP